MSVTFFAIDHAGAIMDDMPELNVSNLNAARIEIMLGYRAQGDNDEIPAGERPVAAFQTALLASVLSGASLGEYANALGQLSFDAAQAGADVIAWA